MKLVYGQHPCVQKSHQRKLKEGKEVQHLEQQDSLEDRWRHYKIQGQHGILTTLKLKLRDSQLRKKEYNLFKQTKGILMLLHMKISHAAKGRQANS